MLFSLEQDKSLQISYGAGILKNPVVQHIALSEKPFLIYGLKKNREQIISASKWLLRQKRMFHFPFLTIDEFNNPAYGVFRGKMPFSHMEYAKTLPPETLKFAKEHIDTVLHYIKDIKPEWKKTRPDSYAKNQMIIEYACTSAISTTRKHNISIYYQLDGIDWQEINKKHKDSYTSKELKNILEAYQQGRPIEHLIFFEKNEVICTEEIVERLSLAFQKPASKRSRFNPFGSLFHSSKLSLSKGPSPKKPTTAPEKYSGKARESLGI
jgi:hypothetical protein